MRSYNTNCAGKLLAQIKVFSSYGISNLKFHPDLVYFYMTPILGDLIVFLHKHGL